MDELRQRLVATWAEFQQSVVYDAIDQWQKRLEACIYAEGGHLEHLLLQGACCLHEIPVATYHKKLSYRRGTARCVVSIEILPIATQQCRNYLYDKS